jgi:hypothetical protein
MPTVLQHIAFGVGGENTEPSKPVSSEKLINMFLHPNRNGAKHPYTVYRYPGLNIFRNFTAIAGADATIRGMHPYKQGLVVVAGTKVYYLKKTGAIPTFLGSTTHSKSPCIMAEHDDGIVICSGSDAYLATETTLAELSDTINAEVSTCTVLDSYVVFSDVGTNVFRVSQPGDALSYDPTEFSTADAYADNIVRVFAINRELWILKERSYEIFTNTGNLDFPFQRITSAAYQRGCVGKYACAQHQGTLFFVGNDFRMYMSQGYQVVPISTYAIDNVLRSDGAITSCHMSAVQYLSHVWLILHTPNNTLVYDVATNVWFRLESSPTTHTFTHGHIHAQLGDRIFSADQTLPMVYEYDDNTFDYAGSTCVCACVSAPVFGSGARMAMYDLRVFFESGTTLIGDNTQGTQPKAMLQMSDDGGRTFGHEIWTSIHPMGAYGKEARFTRLGQFKERCLKLSVSDPIRIAISGAVCKIAGGAV